LEDKRERFMIDMKVKCILGLSCLFILTGMTNQLASASGKVSAGLTVGFAHDTNPELVCDNQEYEDTSLIVVNPFLFFENSLNANRIKLKLDYIQNRFPDSSGITNMNKFTVDADWLYWYSDNMSFFARTDWTVTSFGLQNNDVPEYRGKTACNTFCSGMKYVMDDWYEFEITGTWALRQYRNNHEMYDDDIVHGINWQDWGVSVSGSYILIPEMVFFSNCNYIFRNYSYNDVSPGHQRIEADMGFRSLLTDGTEITVKAHLFRYEFDGEVPRRMKADYTNYGLSFETSIPLSEKWYLNINAGSKYDVSERGLRKYFYNEYVSAGIEYNGLVVVTGEMAHFKIDYHGQEPLFKTHLTQADLGLSYTIYSWCRINAEYRFVYRTEEDKIYRIDNQRLGLSLTFTIPQ
jgi:hypothetical protein